jgi:hypothetical protein
VVPQRGFGTRWSRPRSQAERDTLLAKIGAAETVGQLILDRQKIERTVLKRVEGWSRLMASRQTADGRQMLREVLDGPIRFIREGERYRFDARTTTGRHLAGLLGLSTLCGVPNASQLEPDRSLAPPNRRASGSVNAWATMKLKDRNGRRNLDSEDSQPSARTGGGG